MQMSATAPPKDFREINPAAVYTAEEVAELLRLTVTTIREWVKAGKIGCLPRHGPKAPIRILGSTILGLLGEQGRTLPGPTETRTERRKRAEADDAAIKRLAKGRKG